LFLELVNPCSLFVFVDLSQETLRNLGGHCVVCLVLGLLLLNHHPFFFGLGLARTTIVVGDGCIAGCRCASGRGK
jgi:hypothetical protein